jgi:hypothetical protein
MKSPEEMEKALQRLVPPALSAQAHADVSAMLASLAASASPVAPVAEISPDTKRPLPRVIARWAAAAALVIGAISALVVSQPQTQKLVTTPTDREKPVPAAESDGSPILIDRMLLTDGITVEGTMAAADGRVINQVNRRVETRERYRDAKKGYLITISETRDEKVYLPKKGF